MDENPIPVAPQPQPVDPVEADEQLDVDNVVSMMLLGAEGGNANGAAAARAVNPLEALLGPGGFPQLLDMPQAEDDMVELAIALSLQEHDGGVPMQAFQGFQQGLVNLQGLEGLQNLSGPALQSLQALAAQSLGQVQGPVHVNIQSKNGNNIVNSIFFESNLLIFSIFNRLKKQAITPTLLLQLVVRTMKDQQQPLMGAP